MDLISIDPPAELRTARLLLRAWRATDREPFAALNANPRVMEHFPHALSRAQSDDVADRIQAEIQSRGFGLWALEIPDVTPFAGFVGLAVPHFEAHFMPNVEVGWRLDDRWWGHGYATEGARAAAAFAFDTLHLEEIVSFTVPANVRSRRVMEKLGMTHSPADDFDHPRVPEGHPMRRHVLYRLRRSPHPPDASAPMQS